MSSAIEFPVISNKGNQYGADIRTIFSGKLLGMDRILEKY